MQWAGKGDMGACMCGRLQGSEERLRADLGELRIRAARDQASREGDASSTRSADKEAFEADRVALVTEVGTVLTQRKGWPWAEWQWHGWQMP